MSTDYLVRPYQQGDEKGIVELLKLVFNGWPPFDLTCSEKEHWTWKYLANPYNVKAISLATINDEIIGAIHGTVKKVKLGEKYSLTGMGTDASVHPKYRKLGAFKSLLKLQYDIFNENKIRYRSTISANPILIKWNIREGNHIFPKKISSLIKIKDVKLHLQYSNIKRKTLFSYFYKIMSKLSAVRGISKMKHLEIEVKNISFFNEDANDLWDDTKDYYNYTVIRDKEYLNWRYCDSRGGNYFKKAAFENDELVGYIVLRINSKNKDYPTGYIVDLFTLPERLDIIEKLVSESIVFFDENNVNAFSYMGVKNHPNEVILNRMGFVGIPHEWRIVFHKPFITNEDLQIIKNSPEKKIHISYGDHDWI